MLLIVGTVRIHPSQLDRARPKMASMIEASRAEAGCLEYCYGEDVLDPGLIHVKERWTDRVALDEHFKSAHIVIWRATWHSLGIGERNLYLYDVGESKPI